MSDKWESPDVARDGSIKQDNDSIQDDNRRPKWKRVISNARYSVEVFAVRQRNAGWTLIQAVGFAALLFGAFRLFGIGVYNMDGLGPLPREFFTKIYLPGPWQTLYVASFLWMGLGIAIIILSTR